MARNKKKTVDRNEKKIKQNRKEKKERKEKNTRKRSDKNENCASGSGHLLEPTDTVAIERRIYTIGAATAPNIWELIEISSLLLDS